MSHPHDPNVYECKGHGTRDVKGKIVREKIELQRDWLGQRGPNFLEQFLAQRMSNCPQKVEQQ